MTPDLDADPIVAFFSGGVDHRGRTLTRILHWPDDDLERVHDYIQWVFPTVQPSAVNPFAPLVTEATIAAFTERPELRERLLAGFDRLLAFYGLRRASGSGESVRVEIDDRGFRERASTWLHPRNHNHLRLTRIMQSLAVLGLPHHARALQRCLTVEIYQGPGKGRITGDTYAYWMRALDD